MPIQSVYDGEDVPITVDYTDESDSSVDPDAAPTITITDEDDTEVVSSTAMTGSSGSYEHVWDTSSANGPGTYTAVITAEFSSETKISVGEVDVLST